MSHTSIQIVYDGPALASHEMEVRDLAPALLALGELFEEANATLNGGKAKAVVSVKGSFKTGCFAIDIALAQSVLQQAQDFFAGQGITAAANLMGILGFAGGTGVSLFRLVKWVKGRSVTSVEILDNGKVKIFCGDDHLETEEQVLALFRNWRLRKSLQDVIYTPLQKPGIEYFAVRRGKDDFAVATTDDSSAFIAPEQEEEVISEDDRVASLQLVNVALREDNKWRFFDGASTFYATIADVSFLKRIDSNEERFGKGDILKVLLRERKTLSGEQLKAEYEVVEVLEHRYAGAQLSLPISSPSKPK